MVSRLLFLSLPEEKEGQDVATKEKHPVNPRTDRDKHLCFLFWNWL